MMVVPLFVRVTDCVGAAVPTDSLVNVKLFAESETLVPVPCLLRVTTTAASAGVIREGQRAVTRAVCRRE